MGQQKIAVWRPAMLCALTGALLWLCWPTSPFTFLIFVAWVPLLWLETQSTYLPRFWGYTYLTLLVWNVATTWWVGNTTAPISGVLANTLNALVMTVPWIGYWKTKRRFGTVVGYISLVAYWMTFEYIHLNWELSWPWLTLGNVFAGTPRWVQWYEWTGTTGGTLWVWVVNIVLFDAMRKGSVVHRWRAVVLCVTIPLLLSWVIDTYRKGLQTLPTSGPNVVVVQPNIDPYNEKFTNGTEGQQLHQLISLSESKIDSQTAFVVWPETAIPFEIEEDHFWQTPDLKPLHLFLRRHPNIRLITGLAGFRELPKDTVTPAMHLDTATGKYFEEYNTALQLDSSLTFAFYHKGKLVPGAEIIPYTWMFGFLEKYSLDMGGTSGTLGRGKERTTFSNPQNNFKIAPIICYESIYSAYITGFVRNGANLLTIITNDAWWGDTQGYRQHEQYARLRAIETRRWIARSANTGISCFIDPLGKVYQAQPWKTAAAIKMIVPVETGLTLYVLWGDWLSVIAIAWTIGAVLAGWYVRVRKIRG